jgi:hypothetical protein
MAFEEYKRAGQSNQAGRIGTVPDRVSISVSGKKVLNMGIVIGSTILAERGWAVGEKFTIYFGTGEDKGKMLLKKTESGVAMTQYNKKGKEGSLPAGYIIRLVKQVEPILDFCNTTIGRELVEHTWDDASGGLLVDLPKGFFTASGTPS